MTSTNIQVGIATEKLTSRVLKPPGGGHTNIFAPADPEPPRRNRRNESNLTIGTEAPPSSKSIEANDDIPEPEVAESSPQNGAAQPEPEPLKAAEEAKPAAQEPPKRVRVPPGGFSSGLW